MIVNLTKIKNNTIKEGKLGAFKEAAFGDQKPALRLPQALPVSKESYSSLNSRGTLGAWCHPHFFGDKIVHENCSLYSSPVPLIV